MNKPEHNPQFARMLVDLDSIFDTRLGTIAKFGKEAYVTALADDYYHRKSEHFDGIDPVKFRELYRERDAVTLSGSMMTHIVSMINDFVTRVNVTSATSPIKNIPHVDINVWPYDPPDSVMKMIIEAMQVHIHDKVNIDYVRYSPEDLHYDLVKFTYDHLIMYEIGPWIAANAEDWERRNRGFGELTVFFPMLHRADKLEDVPADIGPDAEEWDRMISTIFNPFQLPIQFFCSVLNPRMATEIPPETEVPSGND